MNDFYWNCQSSSTKMLRRFMVIDYWLIVLSLGPNGNMLRKRREWSTPQNRLTFRPGFIVRFPGPTPILLFLSIPNKALKYISFLNIVFFTRTYVFKCIKKTVTAALKSTWAQIVYQNFQNFLATLSVYIFIINGYFVI